MRSLHALGLTLALLGAMLACGSQSPAPPPPGEGEPAPGTGEGELPGAGAPPPNELVPLPGAPLAPVPCSVTYAKDVLPRIKDQWRCGASGCHGQPGARNPVIDPTNADATYATLTTFVHAGKKLVETTNPSPDFSSLHCLMKGTCGARMPPQGLSDADLSVVEAWLKCGGRRQ